MDIIALVSVIIGGIIAAIGAIMMIIAAFRVSIGWGLAYLFLPFAALVFLFKHWEESRNGFWLNLLGSLILFGAIFSSPPARKGMVKAMPAGINLPMVEKEKPMDLNAQIAAKRNQIDQWEAQFRDDGAALAQEFQTLNAKRAVLKPEDTELVNGFNAEAAAYRQKNEELKKLRQQIDAAQQELSGLLDQRSRGGKPGAANSLPAPAARSGAQVVIFSTSHCPWCTRAKDYFATKGVRYEERDIERSSEAEAEFKRLGGQGVPLILVGSEKIKGFDQRRLDQLL